MASVQPAASDRSDANRAGRPISSGLAFWSVAILACALLGASGSARRWQADRFVGRAEVGKSATFPLKDLPQTIGDWTLMEGGERKLDPLILRVAGSSDHILRIYKDEQTGVTLTAMVLYGRSDLVYGHTPDICYPSSGFNLVEAFEDHPIRYSEDAPPATFRSALYAKTSGGTGGREEVYYAFRHDGRWLPDAAGQHKMFRRSPFMYKVQIQRRVGENERRGENNPSEQFLKAILPEIERRSAAAVAGATTPASG